MTFKPSSSPPPFSSSFNPIHSTPSYLPHFSKDFFIINKQTEELIIKAQFSSLYLNNKLKEEEEKGLITYSHNTYSPSYYPSLYFDSYRNIQYSIELSNLIFLNNEIEDEEKNAIEKKVEKK